MKHKLISVLCLVVMCGLVGSVVIGAEREKKDKKAGQKHASVRLFHNFDTKEEKDRFVQQIFDVFGEQKGVLLASVAIRYTWQLETKTVILRDDTGRTGVPSVVLQMFNKQE